VYVTVRETDVPRAARIYKTKAVWKTKRLPEGMAYPDGRQEKEKARVCVNGAAQRPGWDVKEDELFAPVAKFTSLRTLVSLAAANEWELRQFDVETAFLYAPLEEEVFVRPPAGLEEYDENGEPLVWLLKKSLYGLRQAPRNWYNEFARFLLDYGFEKNPHDPCAFRLLNKDTGELVCQLILYVDDVASGIAGDPKWYGEFLKATQAKYNITEGPLEWCLGIQILQDDACVQMVQTKYIGELLERFDMVDCKTAAVPLDPGSLFTLQDSPKTPEEQAVMLEQPYCLFRCLVGSLLYCAVASRPDIAVAVSKIGHVMSNPGPTHYRRALHILRYLKETQHMGIRFSRRPRVKNELLAYCDADLGGCVDTGKSTSGFFLQLNGGPVSWHSKLQSNVALSTTEAEYMALTSCGCDVVFLRGLLEHMTFVQERPTIVHEDNYGCICLTKNHVLHSRTKHIRLRHHKIRELVEEKAVEIVYCRTDEMIADILTKLLPKQRFILLRDKLLGYTE
jgi:hypothetical protein